MLKNRFMSVFFILIALATVLTPHKLLAESFYDFTFTDTNKKEVKLSEMKGKTVMIVNIATKCGFTGQLDDLEKLYQNYKAKNFIVLGFPSNDFFSQTPESNKEVGDFCRLKYGATFPIIEKQIVKGKEKTPLYKWLTTQKDYDGEIGWNFVKFVINKEGKVVGRFSSDVDPLSKDIKSVIEKNL
jgi:glutathione peroxidase